MKKLLSLNSLRVISLVAVFLGAIISVGFTVYAGRRNASVILPVLFVIWVLSPFIGFTVAHIRAKRRSVSARLALYWLMIIVTLLSLVGYSGILSPPGAKPAGVFLIIPLLSWVVFAIVSLVTRSRPEKSDSV